MNLHPYDNVERRFRHTDASQGVALTIIARILHLDAPPPSEGLLYDLSFFSGGIGILDRLAITLPANQSVWAQVAAALRMRSPEEAGADKVWLDDYIWLTTGEEDLTVSPCVAAVLFINRERRPFQALCRPTDAILFAAGSNVNDWIALWGTDTVLNYLGYSQG